MNNILNDIINHGADKISGEVKADVSRDTEVTKKNLKAEEAAESPPAESADAAVAEKEPKEDAIKKVAEVAAQTAVEAIKKKEEEDKKQLREKFTKTRQEEEAIEYNEEDKKLLNNLKALEEIEPEKYKGIYERANNYLKQAYSVYNKEREKWFKENADIYLSEEDAEKAFDDYIDKKLAALKEKYNLKWDDDDLKKAEDYLSKKPIIEEVKETKNKVKVLEQERKREKIMPLIDNIHKQITTALVKDLTGNENEEHVLGDEIIGDIYKRSKEYLKQFTSAVLLAYTDAINDKNIIDYVTSVIRSAEEEINKLPPEKLVIDGKSYLPLIQWSSLPEEEKSKYWTLTPDRLIAREYERVKALIQKYKEEEEARIEKILQKRYPNYFGSPQSKNQNNNVTNTVPQKVSKPVSPSATGDNITNTNVNNLSNYKPVNFLEMMNKGTLKR